MMTLSKQPSSIDASDALNAWKWSSSADDWVRTAEDIPDEVKEIISEAGPKKGVSPEQFERLFNSEKFRSAVAKGLGFGGKITKLETLKAVSPDDPAFSEAMEVVYRRLLNGPGQHLLELMSNDDLVDLFIASAWAGPFVYGVLAEIKAKKEAAAVAPETPNKKEGGPENE